MTLGQAITKARSNKGLTRKELSAMSGIALTTLGYWERDETSPTIFLLTCLADTLDISLDELVGRRRNGK